MTAVLPLPGTLMTALARDKKLFKDMLHSALEAAGGQERLNEFASANDENYLEVLKLVAKLEPREVSVHDDRSVEALIDAIEKAKLEPPRKATVLEFEAVVVDSLEKAGKS